MCQAPCIYHPDLKDTNNMLRLAKIPFVIKK